MKNCTLSLLLLLCTYSYGQPATGDKAPDLHITNWIQNVPASTSLKGKMLIVDFWATWCGPCLSAMPHLNALVKANKHNSDLLFLAISDENETKIRKLLPNVAFASAVVSDSTGETFKRFKISSVPFCVLIDEDGIIRWSGLTSELTNSMVQQFVQKKTITLPPQPKKTEKDIFYDSIVAKYNTALADTAVKEYFDMPPLMREGRGGQAGRIRPHLLCEAVYGNSLKATIARLKEVSPLQVGLPDSLSRMFVSYCYKSATKLASADMLDSIIAKLGLHLSVRDSLQDVMVLEVVDTTRLYAEPAKPGDHVSKLSSSNEGIVSIVNHKWEALAPFLQNHFSCVVEYKDADRYDRKINMTLISKNWQTLTESMAGYGIKVTKDKRKVTLYDYCIAFAIHNDKGHWHGLTIENIIHHFQSCVVMNLRERLSDLSASK